MWWIIGIIIVLVFIIYKIYKNDKKYKKDNINYELIRKELKDINIKNNYSDEYMYELIEPFITLTNDKLNKLYSAFCKSNNPLFHLDYLQFSKDLNLFQTCGVKAIFLINDICGDKSAIECIKKLVNNFKNKNGILTEYDKKMIIDNILSLEKDPSQTRKKEVCSQIHLYICLL